MASNDSDEAVLFFLCLRPGKLPRLEDLGEKMRALDETLTLKTTGEIAALEDGLVNGELTDDEYDIHEPVCWHVSIGNAKEIFRKDANVLKHVGDKTQILIFAVEDDCAFGHVFAMIHAILEMEDGMLVTDLEPGKQIHLNREQALAFIEEELEAEDEED